MLNEKETELKEIISQLNQIKKQQTKNSHSLNEDMDVSEHDKIIKESKSSKINKESKSSKINKDSKSNKVNNESKSSKIETDSERNIRHYELEQSEKDIIYDELGLNNNQNILKLHKQGKSIVDIAKELKLGQGEVKLVIDLYR